MSKVGDLNDILLDELNEDCYAKRSRHLIDIESLRAKLPKVGDNMVKKSQYPSSLQHGGFDILCPCVVTFVNVARLWYQVEFDYNGIKWRECFKLPEHTPRYV